MCFVINQSRTMLRNISFICLLQLSLVLLVSFSTSIMANLDCPKCGLMHVPFPLSTSPSCGDLSYKVRCNKGTLWFDALNGSSYEVISITPKMKQLIIRPHSFMAESCINTDLRNGGIWLDDKLPFNISSQNTVLKHNCTDIVYGSPMNCSSNSICYRYLKENQEAASRCGNTKICCSHRGGGSQNVHNIKLTPAKCSVFTSFVGLGMDTLLPVNKWPEPGLAIQWRLPREPACSSDSDCKNLPKSFCLHDVSTKQKRCMCEAGLQWDGIHAKCSKIKCETKRCQRKRLHKHITQGLIYGLGSAVVLGSAALLIYGKHHRIVSTLVLYDR